MSGIASTDKQARSGVLSVSISPSGTQRTGRNVQTHEADQHAGARARIAQPRAHLHARPFG